jgi:LAO/AO transport system kinase
VVLTPESGDAIQTLKAGLFEIADIFVVNKADHPGAENLVRDIQAMLHLREPGWWDIPVVATEAVNDVGIEELYNQIERHHKALLDTGKFFERRQQQRRADFIKTIEQKLTRRLLKSIEEDGQLGAYIEKVERGEIDPYSAAEEILSSDKLLTKWLSR